MTFDHLYNSSQINDLGPHVAPGVPAVSVLRIHACACPCVSVRVEKLYFTPPVLL